MLKTALRRRFCLGLLMKETNIVAGDDLFPFRCLQFLPSEDDFEQSDSAIVYLHGAGERGEDLSLIKRYGLPALLAQGIVRTNAAVICPQQEIGLDWDTERLLALILQLRTRHRQILLIGYSLGGIAACQLVSKYGAICEGVLVIAGQAPNILSHDQTDVNLLAVIGEYDDWASTGSFVALLQKNGAEACEVILKEQGHFISESLYQDEYVQEWLHYLGFLISLNEKIEV